MGRLTAPPFRRGSVGCRFHPLLAELTSNASGGLTPLGSDCNRACVLLVSWAQLPGAGSWPCLCRLLGSPLGGTALWEGCCQAGPLHLTG